MPWERVVWSRTRASSQPTNSPTIDIQPTWSPAGRRLAFARFTEDLSPVRTWLVRELAPRPGDRVLELCAGPGETGFAAAEIVGERGRLLSTDFSPEMVEVTRRRGAELGSGTWTSG
jgi:hypothetical protein